MVRYKQRVVEQMREECRNLHAQGTPVTGPHPFGNLRIYEAPQADPASGSYIYYYEYNWGGTSEGAAREDDLEAAEPGAHM